jgi:pimeloyl-ACP methyl ester carboxylesterase
MFAIRITILYSLLLNVRGLSQNTIKTEFIAINWKSTAYSSSRLLTRKAEEPLLVFESGAMTPKENWDTLFSYLPKSTAWVTYDRPGIGQSQEDTAIRNDIDLAKHLHTLLKSIKAAPPYILVGHSYGGPLIRMYTALYPSEVIGLVFIDPTDFMWTRQNEQSVKQVSNNVIGWVGVSEKLFATMLLNPRIPSGYRSELKRVSKDLSMYFIDYSSLPPLPNIPVTLFVAYNYPSDAQKDAMMKQFNLDSSFDTEVSRLRINNFLKLVENCSKGSVICLPKFTHFMHLQDPKIIANGIQTVYVNSKKDK